jgi:hypothetical protein
MFLRPLTVIMVFCSSGAGGYEFALRLWFVGVPALGSCLRLQQREPLANGMRPVAA